MSINSAGINTFLLDGSPDAEPGNSYSGSVCLLSQISAIKYQGSTCKLTQDVQLRLVYSGSVCLLSQATVMNYTGSVCKLGQWTRIPHTGRRLRTDDNQEWDFSLFVGNTQITRDMIAQNVIIRKSEGQNSTIEFRVIIDDPVSFITSIYDGASQVVFDYAQNGVVTRMITALVDSPQIDMLNKLVIIKCSNQRSELINQKMASLISGIGIYSDKVFGEFNDIKSQLDMRLKTTPTAVDFDSYNNVLITPWNAKSTPDFTLTDSDTYRRTPDIDWQNRGDIVNSVSITLDYKRTRLYHTQRNFSWTASYFGNPNDYAANLYTSPTVTMINSAIKDASWKKVGDGSYTAVYTLVNNWFGLTYTPNVLTLTDTNNNTVTDLKGDILYSKIAVPSVETINVMQASWSAAIHFSQFIQESYTLSLTAPQSINQNGQVTQNNSYEYADDYDATIWEEYAKAVPVPAGAVQSGTNYYLDIAELIPGTLNQALKTCLNLGKTSILATHRNTQVTVQSKLIPNLELSHTVELDTDLVQCRGKVVEIEHVFNLNSGDTSTKVVIALSRVEGNTISETTLIPPARPGYSPSYPTDTITLGNHYGQTPVDGTISDTWNGFIGNKATTYTTGFFNFTYKYRSDFTDIFRVDTPAISDALRAIAILPVSANYNINIPNDPLNIDLSII